jgi:hypothetical protein
MPYTAMCLEASDGVDDGNTIHLHSYAYWIFANKIIRVHISKNTLAYEFVLPITVAARSKTRLRQLTHCI